MVIFRIILIANFQVMHIKNLNELLRLILLRTNTVVLVIGEIQYVLDILDGPMHWM